MATGQRKGKHGKPAGGMAPPRSPEGKLFAAARAGDGCAARELLASGAPVAARDVLGRAPLACAAAAGRLDVVRALIEFGAEVDAVDDERATALIEACRSRRLDVARILVEAGADLGAMTKGNPGLTPLLVAIVNDDHEMAWMLARAGADLERCDAASRSAWSAAEDWGRRALAAWFRGFHLSRAQGAGLDGALD